MRKRLTRAKAIKAKCIDCMGGDKSEVRKMHCRKMPPFSVQKR